jgi:hypothetical protein
VLSLIVSLAVVTIASAAVTALRARSFEKRGCPGCRGGFVRGDSWLQCRTCKQYWTLDGVPAGEIPPDEASQLPRAEARIRRP